MDEIKKLLGSDKLIIGEEKTIKAIKNQEVKKVFVASNAKNSLKEDLEYYAGIFKFEIDYLKLNNEDLGVMCRKPFRIQVLAVK